MQMLGRVRLPAVHNLPDNSICIFYRELDPLPYTDALTDQSDKEEQEQRQVTADSGTKQMRFSRLTCRSTLVPHAQSHHLWSPVRGTIYSHPFKKYFLSARSLPGLGNHQ